MNEHAERALATGVAMSRRQLLIAALGLLMGQSAGGLRIAAAQPMPASPSASLLTVLTDPAAAARFGRAYLAAHPDEADVEILVGRLSASLSAHTGATDSAAAAITELVQAEYVTEALLRVDGWLLAPSEARLYAVAALTR
jgi:hypothetical protein